MDKLKDVTMHRPDAETKEPDDPKAFGARCDKCTAPEGVICTHPHIGPECPINAGQNS
jgi:hypothetical protein